MAILDRFSDEYAFLSNFYPCEFMYRHEVWKSSEHAYQAMKATNRHDRDRVRSQATSGWAKSVGRCIECRPDWPKVKLHFMHNIVLAKFSVPKLEELLLSTGDAELIEGNRHGDTFWGQVNGVGENHLGRILVEVRTHLRQKRKL